MDKTQLVKVRREPSNYEIGTVKFENITDVLWNNVSGGRGARTGMDYPYGKIWCDQIIDGSVAHSGIHGNHPHEIKVCILKKDNKEIFDELLEVWGLGKRPATRHNDIADKVRQIVLEEPGILGIEVKRRLEKQGIGRESTGNAIRYLRKHEFKNKSSLRCEKAGTTHRLYLI